MAKKIIYINALGAELELTNSAPFLLQKFDTNEDVNIYNSKGMNQDGASYLGSTLDIRNISLEIAVIGNSEEELINYRNRINSVFNPKLGEGYLIYKDDVKERKVKCIANKTPYFAVVSNVMNKCLVNLIANNPFWTDIFEENEEIAIWIGGMTFPFSFPVTFAKRTASRKLVINEGDVETPVTITFKGPAANPCVTNTATGEYIKVKRVLSNTDTLAICTEFGNKRVEIIDGDGNRTNAFNWIDLGSSFFQLQVGDNVIEYISDNNLVPEGVLVAYRNRYIGV